MKKQVQQTGVRKWYGDDFITIQNEILKVVDGHFSAFGQQFILTGCEIDGATVNAGIVYLNYNGSLVACAFEGAENVTWSVFFKVVKTDITRQYIDGAEKPITEVYTAELSATNDDNYLELKQNGTTARFADVIQDTKHQMVSDSEKTGWDGQANAAVETVRGGIAETFDTLEKLRADLQTKINNINQAGTDYDLIYQTIRGNIDESLNTLELLKGYIDDLSYLPEYKGRAELTTATINWTGKPEQYKTLTADTSFDASGLIVGKTIGLLLDGAFNTTFSSKFKKVLGSPDPDPNETNYIQMKCLNSTAGSELIIYTVVYLEN